MSNRRNHRRQDERRTEHGPRWESQNPGKGCNSTHVARARAGWKRINARAERRTHKEACEGARDPMDYDQWLALTPAQREAAHIGWDTNSGDNLHIPEEALRRLIETSEVPIVGGFVGQWHGREYVLSAMVDGADLTRLPKPLESSFDGFRVMYIAAD